MHDDDIDLDHDGKITKQEIRLYEVKTRVQRNLAVAAFGVVVLMILWIFFTPDVERIVRLMGLIETILFLLITVIGTWMGFSALIGRGR